MENIFGKFIIVDEKSFTDLKIEKGDYCQQRIYCVPSSRAHQNCVKCQQCSSALMKNVSTFTEVNQFASFEFKINNSNQRLEIKDIGNDSTNSDVPLAQIVYWQWNEKGEQVINETKILNIGGQLVFGGVNLFSIIVRILKEKQKTDQNPCPPISLPDDDLTVQIGEEKITLSANWFMSVSPVINRMLSVEMREKQQRLITLNELGVNMEQFKEFVNAIPASIFHVPIPPNPKNVLMVLKLADYFQIDWLKKRCEMHLINCVEIPLIDRFLLIEKYGLDNLKKYFWHLNVDVLRAFFKSNREQLSNEFISDGLLASFVVPLAG